MATERRPRRNLYDRLRPLRRLVRPIEAAQVRRLGKSLLSIAFRTPVLVLHSTGRLSGIVRSTTLAFHRLDDESLVLVGGADGQARTPDWVANPPGQLGRRHLRRPESRQRPCPGAQWSRTRGHAAGAPEGLAQIDTYEKRAGRDVPVFRPVPT